ncbi:MAG: sugar phosphate nucleotidyltransferase [Saprospiraceae bacterium]
MKIIIPMAGRGTRLRPHTLTVPKPLIPIAGKPMVQRLVEDLNKGLEEKVTEVAFIIGDFGKEVEAQLKEIAKSIGAIGKIYYQDQPLGIAHALLCARESMEGKVMVAFSDTLFKADFKFDDKEDGVIWVQRVENPSAFGVVKTNEEGVITHFVEKPQEFVSDQAIVGIYYFRDGDNLEKELQYLLDNDIKVKGEFQLTSALENMEKNGLKFKTGEIEEWLDCGNKEAVVYTNQRILDIHRGTKTVSNSAKVKNSIIRMPCFIGDDVEIKNCVIGPFVSVGEKTVIKNSVIKNSVIQSHTTIRNAVLENSMIGNHVSYEGTRSDVDLGDYSKRKE